MSKASYHDGPGLVLPTGVGPISLTSVETGSTPAIRSRLVYL